MSSRMNWLAGVGALLLAVGCGPAATGEERTTPEPPPQEEPGVETQAQASAESVDTKQLVPVFVTCPIGSFVTQYSPPLRNTPQTVTINGNLTLSNCVSLFGGGVTSATTLPTTVVRPNFSCNDLLGTVSLTVTYRWNTGETSTLVMTVVSADVQGNAILLTQAGTVTAGKFLGATAVATNTLLTTNLGACSSPGGLMSLSGPSTLTLTKLL